MGDGGHQGLRQGDLPHIEDEAEDKGDVDVAQQGADQIDRLGVGAAVSAHHPHTQGIDQQVEGYAEHDGQGQALLAKQGQGHGEAHKAVVAEGGTEGPDAPPARRYLQHLGDAPGQGGVQGEEDQSDDDDDDPVHQEGGVKLPGGQGGEDGAGQGDLQQKAGHGGGGGRGDDLCLYGDPSHAHEKKQADQAGKYHSDV